MKAFVKTVRPKWPLEMRPEVQGPIDALYPAA
jgi:hypothetical protein